MCRLLSTNNMAKTLDRCTRRGVELFDAAMLKCVVVLVTVLVSGALGLDNGLARTPPMGWTSSVSFGCVVDCVKFPHHCISEELFKAVADSLVNNGYLKSGYEYLILDDCWLARQRDGNGKLQGDPERFPSGMKALGDYIHSKGLKFGLSAEYGTLTCAGNPGVFGYFKEDAETFASWGVDYVKLDGGCFADPSTLDDGFPEFGMYLLQANRSIVFSCSWPVLQEGNGIDANYSFVAEHCNLWRIGNNIDGSWRSVSYIINYIKITQDRYAALAGPGHWNDPDMIIIGNNGLSPEQSKAQLAVWAIVAAPFLLSHDVRTETAETRRLLQNKELIAVDQDLLGIQGRWVTTKDLIQVWTRPLENEEWAIVFVSMRADGYPYLVNISLSEIGIQAEDQFTLTELFNATQPFRISAGEQFGVKVSPSGALLFKACQNC